MVGSGVLRHVDDYFFLKGNENKEKVMDLDTLILLVLTLTAFFWWFALRVQEDRRYVKELAQQEKDRAERAERVKQLTNRR